MLAPKAEVSMFRGRSPEPFPGRYARYVSFFGRIDRLCVEGASTTERQAPICRSENLQKFWSPRIPIANAVDFFPRRRREILSGQRRSSLCLPHLIYARSSQCQDCSDDDCW